MTSNTMLMRIQGNYRQRQHTVRNGVTICLQLEVQQPPLIVPEDDGQWILRECTECGIGTWKLKYRFRVPVYYVKTQGLGGSWIEIEDTRTTNQTEVVDKVMALNRASSTLFLVGIREATSDRNL